MMKMLKNSFYIWFLIAVLGFYPGIASSLSSNPLSRMDSAGNAVAIWTSVDENYNSIIVASTLPVGETTWTTPVNISYLIGNDIYNNSPSLFNNANGDLIVVWDYADSNTNFFVAAAMYPVGTSVGWTAATVSTSEENANYGDHKLAGNDTGDLILMWTSTVNGGPVIRSSTTTVADNATWSTPINAAE